VNVGRFTHAMRNELPNSLRARIKMCLFERKNNLILSRRQL